MDIRWVLVIGAAFLFFAVFLAGYALLMTRPNLEDRLRGSQPSKRKLDILAFLRRSEKVLKPLGEMIPRAPEEMTRHERRLAQAGIRRRDATYLFNGIKVVTIILIFLICTMIEGIRSNVILLAVLPILLGAMIPDLILTRMMQNRKSSLQRALPDALDLAVVSVEAGLGLDQSLVKIGQELRMIYPALSEEINLYSLESTPAKSGPTRCVTSGSAPMWMI
jgi:tight adherence protein C